MFTWDRILNADGFIIAMFAIAGIVLAQPVERPDHLVWLHGKEIADSCDQAPVCAMSFNEIDVIDLTPTAETREHELAPVETDPSAEDVRAAVQLVLDQLWLRHVRSLPEDAFLKVDGE